MYYGYLGEFQDWVAISIFQLKQGSMTVTNYVAKFE